MHLVTSMLSMHQEYSVLHGISSLLMVGERHVSSSVYSSTVYCSSMQFPDPRDDDDEAQCAVYAVMQLVLQYTLH